MSSGFGARIADGAECVVPDTNRGTTAAEAVEAILGAWGTSVAERAMGLASGARLLAAEAQGGCSPSAAVDQGALHQALARCRGETIEQELDELARHLGCGARPAWSFQSLPAPAGDSTEAWARLLAAVPDQERRRAGLAVPAVGSDAAESLLGLAGAALALLGESNPIVGLRWALWAARARRWGAGEEPWDGPVALERLARRVVEELEDPEERSSMVRALLEERLAGELDRGRVKEAAEIAAAAGGCTPLAQLVQWAVGQLPLENVSPVDAGPFDPLSRLRRSGDQPVLPLGSCGFLGPSQPSLPAAMSGGLARRWLGARCVLLLDVTGTEVRLLGRDLAPGLEGRLHSWLRDGCVGEHGLVEPLAHALTLEEPCALVEDPKRPGDGRAIGRSCIGGTELPARAVVCAPIGAGDSRRVAWLEFDHRLLPGPERLRAAGELWRAALVSGAEVVRARGRECAPGGRRADRGRADSGWQDAVERSVGKQRRRRWAVFGADLELVAQGGDARMGVQSRGGAWAVRQCLTDGASIRYGAPIRTTAWMAAPQGRGGRTVFHSARSGAVLPLSVGDVPVAAVVVESVRGGDAGPADVRRWSKGLRSQAPRLYARELERRMGPGALFGIAADAPDGRRLLQQIARLGRAAGEDAVILGPRRSGRCAIGRAIHAASRCGSGQGALIPVQAGASVHELEAAVDRVVRVGGTLLVRDLESHGSQSLRRLAQLNGARRGAGVRLVATASALPRGVLGPAEVLRVPALALRRHWVPAMVESWCRRAGCELGAATASELWRQSWDGGPSALVTALERAWRQPMGMDLDPERVREAVEEELGAWVERLNPSQTDELTLASAVWTSRTSTGRINKVRAARLLGWDPATLLARLRALELMDLRAVMARLAQLPPIGRAPAS